VFDFYHPLEEYLSFGCGYFVVQSWKTLLFVLFGLILSVLQFGVWGILLPVFFLRHGLYLRLLRAQYNRHSGLTASTNTSLYSCGLFT